MIMRLLQLILLLAYSGTSTGETIAIYRRCNSFLCGVLIWIIRLSVCDQVSAYSYFGSAENQGALIRDLSYGYNTLIRPVTNLSDPVKIHFGIVLVLILGVNERDQVFKTNLWYRLGWNDPQLAWTPEKYGNIQAVRMPADKVWTPDVVLLNNADGKYGVSYKSNVVIYSKGDISWLPPSIYKSTCEINVVYFPFDIQTCKMRFRSWTWNSQEVLLESFGETNFVDLTDFTDSGTWCILEAKGQPMFYYTPDKQPRIEMVYYFVIQRRPLFYTVNLLIPTCLVTFLTVLVFYLPSASGEKVALSISISVTLVFYLLLVSKILPPSKDLPLMAKYLLFAFVMNFVSVVVTVWTIHLHYRSPKIHPAPPKWVQYLFFQFLPVIFLMRKPRRYVRSHQFSVRNLSIPGGKAASPNVNSATATPRTSHTMEPPECFQKENLIELQELTAQNRKRSKIPLVRTESITSDLIDDPTDALRHNRRYFDALDVIADSYRRKDHIRQIEEDWKWMATVIDRGLLWIFFIVTAAGSLSILMQEQEIFGDFRCVR
ncbi:acetylcholine receptor subunit beta-like 1 [Paramacrobiotus metropolitanus]|uniref:acetylcholine receptor subunit beta-like 1 n=1 Tax=Paramacrobiotus metropolitanus TaxID=2943436 RepID=UPI0024456FF3|nr:acetylcholine receptor subunit beta-like 1 [Paramacrobiotus metropolitanus]